MKISMILLLGSIGCSLMAQKETVPLNDVSLWGTSNPNFTQKKECLEVKAPGQYTTEKRIRISPDTSCEFKGEIRKAPDSDSALFLAGFLLYDKDGKQIMIEEVNTIPGTDTELTVPAKAGDTVIQIKNGARWSAKPFHLAAFETDLSFRDLPNRNISAPGIALVTRSDANWKVTLSHPLTKAYPAGTKVREHSSGGYFYTAQKNPGADWSTFSGTIKGISTRLVSGRHENKFWPGTVFIAPMIMPNWNWSLPERNQLKTEIRNLVLELNRDAK